MTRKFLVAIISLIYMSMGLVNLYYSLMPVLSSSGLFVVRLFPLIGGALAFHAGLTMFRQNEFGRKLVIFWLSVRIVVNAISILWLSMLGTGFWVENFLGETIYSIKNPYALQGYLLAWILIAFLIIIFLSQAETREIFTVEVIKDAEPDIIFE